MSFKWTPYQWTGFALCVGLMGTALASPLYPIYQQAWGLLPSHITQVFAAYMLGALASLLFLGRLTNRLGFLAVLRAGMVLVTLGAAGSALAWNMTSFAVCRFVVGIAAGMITPSASAGLIQLHPKGDLHRAGVTFSLLFALGFGLGPLVGGLVAQWAPMPLKTAYAPPLALGLLAIYVLLRVRWPQPAASAAPGAATRFSYKDVLPSLSRPQKPFRRHYALGCMAVFSVFAIFGLFGALAPSFVSRITPWHGPLVAGLSISVFLFLSAIVQWIAPKDSPRVVALGGFFGLAAGSALLMTNVFVGSPWLFALSVMVLAAGHALCNLMGMAIVGKVSRPANRAALLSTYMIVGYLGTIVPILGLGWLSDAVGLNKALIVFCLCLGLLTLFLGLVSIRARVLPMPRA